MKLKCEAHKKRVWVNPITSTVHHRSPNRNGTHLLCGSKYVGFAHTPRVLPSDFRVNARCIHCGLPEPSDWPWGHQSPELCKKRQGKQQHVYG